MVEKVVPFPKDFATLSVGAMEEPDDSPGLLLASVLVNDVLGGLWDVLLDSNLVEVEVLSEHNGNFLILEFASRNKLLIVVEIFQEIEIESLLDLFYVHFYQFVTLEKVLERVQAGRNVLLWWNVWFQVLELRMGLIILMVMTTAAIIVMMSILLDWLDRPLGLFGDVEDLVFLLDALGVKGWFQERLDDWGTSGRFFLLVYVRE